MLKQVLQALIVLSLMCFLSPAGHAEQYDVEQIKTLTKALGEQLSTDREWVKDLLVSLEMATKNEWFKAQMTQRQCNGVFVFTAGKGGLVVSFMEGDGKVSFAGGRQDGKIKLKSWSIGAQVGGEAIYGVGLIMDLRHEGDFGGEYRGKGQSATAGQTATYNWQVFSKADDADGLKAHQLFMLQQGRGFNVGVAINKIQIETVW
jgi:hypothetical protein